MKKTFPIIILSLLILLPQTALAANAGKIFLQVEAHGEAWYVNPMDNFRYYLGRPNDAFNLMRQFGLGISNANLAKIPVGAVVPEGASDADWDGLSDYLESVLGTNPLNPDTDNDDYSDADELATGYDPLGPGKIGIDQKLVNSLLGRIVLQVEKNGEAWYINPDNGRRYFLGRPADAFALMRALGVGISNKNLAAIPANYTKKNIEFDAYAVKYPETWNYGTGTSKLKVIANAPIAHDAAFRPSEGNVTLRFYELQPTKDATLATFDVNSLTNADLLKKETLQIGVKPAKKFIYRYNKKFTDANKTEIDFGEKLFFNVMINTREFIRAEMLIPNQSDIYTYETYFNQMMRDLIIK